MVWKDKFTGGWSMYVTGWCASCLGEQGQAGKVMPSSRPACGFPKGTWMATEGNRWTLVFTLWCYCCGTGVLWDWSVERGCLSIGLWWQARALVLCPRQGRIDQCLTIIPHKQDGHGWRRRQDKYSRKLSPLCAEPAQNWSLLEVLKGHQKEKDLSLFTMGY